MSLLVKPTPVKKRIQYIGATYETTIKFMYYLLKKHRKTVCSPLIFNQKSGFIIYDKTQLSARSVDMNECIRPGIRFVFVPINLVGKNGHSNMLIYDTRDKRLEWFEPHGYKEPHDEDLLNYIIKAVNVPVKDDKITMTYSSSCPRGVQSLEANGEFKLGSRNLLNDGGGMCFMWSLWYLDLKFTNSNINSRNLLKNMPNEVSNFRKFITYYTIYQQSLLRKNENVNFNKLLPKVDITPKLAQIKQNVDQLISTNKKLTYSNINTLAPKNRKLYQVFINYLMFKLKGGKTMNLSANYSRVGNNTSNVNRIVDVLDIQTNNRINLNNPPSNINNINTVSNYSSTDVAKLITYLDIRNMYPEFTWKQIMNSNLKRNVNQLVNNYTKKNKSTLNIEFWRKKYPNQ